MRGMSPLVAASAALAAIAMGTLAAFLTPSPASGTAGDLVRLDWRAAVTKNSRFCFGVLGWHGNGTAADIFADDAGPCYGPVSTAAYTTIKGTLIEGPGSTTHKVATATIQHTQGGSTVCDITKVTVKDGINSKVRAEYRYIHTSSISTFTRNIYASRVSGYVNSSSIGTTIEDSGCPWEGFHAHQDVISGPSRNNSLVANEDYPATTYVHAQNFVEGS